MSKKTQTSKLIASRIREKQKRIMDYEQEENVEEERDKFQKQIDIISSTMLEISLKVQANVIKLAELKMENHIPELQRLDLQSKQQTLNEEKRQRSGELSLLREAEAECAQKVREKKELTRQLQKEASDFAPINEEIHSILQDQTIPTDIEDIETHIEECTTKLQLSRSKNPNALLEYKNRLAEIEAKRKEVVNTKAYLEQLVKEIETKKNTWLPRLHQHIQQLNAKFSEFLRLMGNSGEISLNAEEVGEEAYDKYALNVKVAFRNSQSLENLNAKMQSGGERSVSTMLFLIAMQDVTQSPFRLVDEINQGMDPNNERAIFQLVADYAVGKGKPQYFLITPKLLADLKFTKDMTILCILNGPWLDEDWDPAHFFSKIEGK